MELLRLGIKPVLGLSLNTHAAGWKGEKHRERHRTERYLWYLHLSKVKYLDFCFGIELVRSYNLTWSKALNKVSLKPIGQRSEPEGHSPCRVKDHDA